MITDEEKEAIEDLKEVIELYNDECLITIEDDIKSIKIILELIERNRRIKTRERILKLYY